jgi:hypothetical protein
MIRTTFTSTRSASETGAFREGSVWTSSGPPAFEGA